MNRCFNIEKYLAVFMDKEKFQRQLDSLLDTEQVEHLHQLEEMALLAGKALKERDMERYQEAEIILESLEEASSELHGFLHGLSAAIAAKNSDKQEPFKDEFLIRQFADLPESVQSSIANDFWQVDPELATILNKFMALSIKEAMTHNDKTINYKLPSGRDEFATVKIPAGVQHGVTFKFPGMGDDAIKNMPRGDLMVIMSVLDSDGYTRKGNDLYTDKTIDCFQAIRGHDFNLKTLEDKIIKVKVPAGTQPNTVLQVKGQGMPVHKTIGIRGNLYVKIHVLIPQLSAADLKKIKDL